MFTAVLLAVVLIGPGCMRSVQLNILQPAAITLPSEINKMVLINRYKPEKGQGIWNVLEGAITGEWIGTDKRGTEASLIGLQTAANQSPRFSLVRGTEEVRGSGLGTFPAPLLAQEVQGLCDRYTGQALVTIEAFDSDGIVERGTYEKEVTGRNGEKSKVLTHTVRNKIRVTVGWRLYHRDGHLLDEFMMVEEVVFNGEGSTPTQADANLPSRERMVQQIGNVTGDKYWHRISPMYVWVSRSYYSKGNDGLKEGKRRVQVNDWEMAEKMWNAGLNDPKMKKAGRCAYNLALAQEMKGDLDGAIEWTKKAYAQYRNNAALDYQRILQQRVFDLQRLEEQMK